MREFWTYVENHFPSVPPLMFRGMPMYKFTSSYLDGYVMFTAAKTARADSEDFDVREVATGRFPPQ